MMLRYKADIRTILFMGISTSLILIQWRSDHFHWILFIWSCLMAVSITAIAHNHNHLGIWKSAFLNHITDYWLTLLYGYPTFGWIPTHNMNHHVHNNKDQDYTATHKISKKNNLLTLVCYPFYSGMVQQKANVEYLKKLRSQDYKKWLHCVSQVVLLVSLYVIAAILDWKKALLFIIIPHQVGLNTVLIFNYIQHVHTDENSNMNHSRNIIGWPMNAFLFNNGFHTIHHMQPKKHWSLTPKAHAEISSKIDPSLNEKSFLWFMVRTYILSIFISEYRTRPFN